MDLPFPTPALFTAKGPFEAPDWVPVCVQSEAELLRNADWEPTRPSEKEETIRHLLTDERRRPGVGPMSGTERRPGEGR